MASLHAGRRWDVSSVRVGTFAATIAAIVMALTIGASAYAGDGTPSNPWHNNYITSGKPTGIPRITQVYEGLNVTSQHPNSFWATNQAVTTAAGGGFYIGPQTDGTVHGAQCPGGLCAHRKLIVFSFFSPAGADKVRVLTPNRCDQGADDTHGVSCSYVNPTNDMSLSGDPWAAQTSYRFSVTISAPTHPDTECPTYTPTNCWIYRGYYAPSTDVTAKLLLAKIGVAYGVYGDVAYENGFVEPFFNNGCAVPAADRSLSAGRFARAHYVVGTTEYLANSFATTDYPIVGDVGDPDYNHWRDHRCARTYIIQDGNDNQAIVSITTNNNS